MMTWWLGCMHIGGHSITHYMQARHELNGTCRLTEMINLTQQLPWPRTLFLLLPLGFLPSFLLFLEARYTTVTLNVSWCNHTVVRRNGVWQNIVHVQKTYVHKPCIFCGHIWKGATYSIWEVHFITVRHRKSLYSCSPRRVSRKLCTVYEMVSFMAQDVST